MTRTSGARRKRSGSVSRVNADYISVQDVSLRLGRRGHRRLALDKVSITCRKNGITGLIGPSGSGKSTLLKVIGGLLAPETGEVTVGGLPAAAAVRENMFGLVFQQPVLLPWRSVLENVTFTAELVSRNNPGHAGAGSSKAREQRALELLEMVNLTDHRHKFPRELSGGMQQRVSIARALMTKPQILLMDEPFSALDEVIRERLNLTLLDIWEKTRITIVFVTHALSEAAFLTDEVYVMGSDPGRIVDRVPVKLPRPRTLDTFREPAFAELTMYLREVMNAASEDDQA